MIRLLGLMALVLAISSCSKSDKPPTSGAEPAAAGAAVEPAPSPAGSAESPAKPAVEEQEAVATKKAAVQQRRGLSEPEALLQDLAAAPEPHGGAVDLSAACTESLKASDYSKRGEMMARSRMVEEAQAEVNKWITEAGAVIRKADENRLVVGFALLDREYGECMKKEAAKIAAEGSAAGTAADQVCVAMIEQDPAKCPDHAGDCIWFATLGSWVPTIAKWKAGGVGPEDCTSSALSGLFVTKELCQLAGEKGCSAAMALWQRDLCKSFHEKSPPVECNDENRDDFWCGILALAESKEIRVDCEKWVKERGLQVNAELCLFLENTRRVTSCTDDFVLSIPTRYLTSYGTACPVMDVILGREVTPSSLMGQCEARAIAALFGGGVADAKACDCFSDPHGKKICQAGMVKDVGQCPVELPRLAEETTSEIGNKCRRLLIELRAKSQEPKGEGAQAGEGDGRYVMEFASPYDEPADCIVSLSVPAEDGEVWRIPVEVHVKDPYKRYQIDLPKTVTTIEGVKITQRCTWTPRLPSPAPQPDLRPIPMGHDSGIPPAMLQGLPPGARVIHVPQGAPIPEELKNAPVVPAPVGFAPGQGAPVQ